jgi:hypothetical protein
VVSEYIQTDIYDFVLDKSELPPMHHFYHIYCGKNHIGQEDTWKESVGTHLKAFKDSGLQKYIPTIHVGFVGEDNNIQDAKNFIAEHEIDFTVAAENRTGFEQVTQVPLYEFAQSNDGYVLYSHSKGSFNFTDQNRSWCKSMIYFNVVRWEDAVMELKNVDAVGCNWHDFTNQHASHLGGPHTGQRWFAGTFWWSRLDRIRDIGHGPTMNTRWDAEVWIGQIPDITIYDINRADGPYPGAVVTEW